MNMQVVRARHAQDEARHAWAEAARMLKAMKAMVAEHDMPGHTGTCVADMVDLDSLQAELQRLTSQLSIAPQNPTA